MLPASFQLNDHRTNAVRRRLAIEPLETRTLLNASWQPPVGFEALPDSSLPARSCEFGCDSQRSGFAPMHSRSDAAVALRSTSFRLDSAAATPRQLDAFQHQFRDRAANVTQRSRGQHDLGRPTPPLLEASGEASATPVSGGTQPTSQLPLPNAPVVAFITSAPPRATVSISLVLGSLTDSRAAGTTPTFSPSADSVSAATELGQTSRGLMPGISSAIATPAVTEQLDAPSIAAESAAALTIDSDGGWHSPILEPANRWVAASQIESSLVDAVSSQSEFELRLRELDAFFEDLADEQLRSTSTFSIGSESAVDGLFDDGQDWSRASSDGLGWLEDWLVEGQQPVLLAPGTWATGHPLESIGPLANDVAQPRTWTYGIQTAGLATVPVRPQVRTPHDREPQAMRGARQSSLSQLDDGQPTAGAPPTSAASDSRWERHSPITLAVAAALAALGLAARPRQQRAFQLKSLRRLWLQADQRHRD